MTTPYLDFADGHRIPQLGLGVYKVDTGIAEQLVDGALRLGYRHVDTAKLYANEAEVGRGVRSSGVPRDDVFVTTKVWDDDQGFDATLRAAERSLAELDLGYIDLYLIHWPCPAQDLYVDTWRALQRLRDEGVVKSIGVSNFHPHHIERLIAETGEKPVINQVELHPRLPQHTTRAFDSEHGILTESWAPLGRGTVLDEPVLAEIAARYGRSPAQVVIRWHLQQGLVVIPKSNSIDRIRQNLEVSDFELDAHDLAAIATLETGERTGMDPDLHEPK
ncbi:aldo/keto reductase [Schumannella luteola]|uniref:2,5-diketo-D-gluconate reductase A n=1 Tax=Schumannella luteola TaxID=472059 RepID=A0A852YJG6_9MICO|nr:2,5-diketo-D-gluconate reductase A [Schumannella luteola]TPX02114.1 aldo/keto reductase [Schumannella luteola]